MRPTLATIRAARERLAGVIHPSPLMASRSLNDLANSTLQFKTENLQVTGSFKIRGAYNRIADVAKTAAPGVVTASSGNHGQAVAWAARAFGLPAHIVVPTTAPVLKVAAAEAFGATVEYCGTTSRDRLDRARDLAEQAGYIFVPPYDDPAVMAGQGTIGLEILDQWADVDTVVVPIGGGGLISGIATAIKESRPGVRVVGVEPVGAAKASAALRAGRRVELDHTESIADGLTALSLGTLTYPVIREYVDDVVTVTDDQIADAFWLLFTRMKLVVEPSGCTAAAYALSGALPRGTRAAVVLSGGNLDPGRLPTLLTRAKTAAP